MRPLPAPPLPARLHDRLAARLPGRPKHRVPPSGPGRTPRLARFALSALVALVACLGATARAAPFDLKGEDWEGLSQFLHIAELELGSARTAPAATLDLHQLDPADAVILVHPTRPMDVDGLSAFMRAGGRVVLLDDQGTGDDLLSQFGIQRRPMPAHPAHMLRGNPALAIAEPAAEHPAVRDVSQVVTNHATGLEQPALSPVLVVHAEHPADDVLLAIAGVVGKGRLLAIGDASVLINSMLRYPGNGALALAVVRYALEDDDWGKRGGKLHVLANDFRTVGTFGDESLLAGAASEVQRVLADTLATLRHQGVPPLVIYLAAVVLGIGIVVWTVTRAGKTHHSSTPAFARRVPVVAQGGIAGHAAVLGSPRTSRTLAVIELKNALEEELATRLGLRRAPPTEQLVAGLRAAGLLDESGARALSGLFATMKRIESRLGRRPAGALREGPSDAEVLSLAAQVRELRRRLGLDAARDGREDGGPTAVVHLGGPP